MQSLSRLCRRTHPYARHWVRNGYTVLCKDDCLPLITLTCPDTQHTQLVRLVNQAQQFHVKLSSSSTKERLRHVLCIMNGFHASPSFQNQLKHSPSYWPFKMELIEDNFCQNTFLLSQRSRMQQSYVRSSRMRKSTRHKSTFWWNVTLAKSLFLETK